MYQPGPKARRQNGGLPIEMIPDAVMGNPVIHQRARPKRGRLFLDLAFGFGANGEQIIHPVKTVKPGGVAGGRNCNCPRVALKSDIHGLAAIVELAGEELLPFGFIPVIERRFCRMKGSGPPRPHPHHTKGLS